MGYDINDFNMGFFSLEGKNAIVTGGNSGLGQTFALALAKAGANIFCFAAVDDDGTTRELIEGCGVEYEFMLGDIRDHELCVAAADKCAEVFGSIDILINCAGICLIDDVLDFGREQWDPMIDINLTGAFDLSHEVARYMIPQKNSEKLIEAIEKFLKLNMDEKKKMGLAARAKVEREFDRQIVVEAYMKEIEG